MKRPAVSTHRLMALNLALIVLAVSTLGRSEFYRVLVHNGMAVVAVGITLYVVHFDPVPMAMRERRLLTVVASITALLMITG